MFSGPCTTWPGIVPNWAGRISLLIQTLSTFWAERIWIMIFFLIFFLTRDPLKGSLEGSYTAS